MEFPSEIVLNPSNWVGWLAQLFGIQDFEAAIILMIIGLLGIATAARFFRGVVAGIFILAFLSVVATGSTAGIQAFIEAARDNGILAFCYNILKAILQPLLDLFPRG